MPFLWKGPPLPSRICDDVFDTSLICLIWDVVVVSMFAAATQVLRSLNSHARVQHKLRSLNSHARVQHKLRSLNSHARVQHYECAERFL
jgi:hypothetical protein